MKNNRSLTIQKRLADALVRLMAENDYAGITISRICSAAGVGRATFYRHFQDKDDLLVFRFNQLVAECLESVDGLDEMSTNERARVYLELIYDNRDYILLLFKAGKRDILERYLLTLIVKAPDSVLETYKRVGSAYYFLGIIHVWIKRNFADSPAELQEIMRQISSHASE